MSNENWPDRCAGFLVGFLIGILFLTIIKVNQDYNLNRSWEIKAVQHHAGEFYSGTYGESCFRWKDENKEIGE